MDCLLVPVLFHCDVPYVIYLDVIYRCDDLSVLLNVLLLVYKCTRVDVEIRCLTSVI